MVQVKINGKTYDATISGTFRDTAWGSRESKSITLAMGYETAMATFVDDVEWSVLYQPPEYIGPDTQETVKPDVEVYDNSAYCLAGPITDNRDGTVTVKMGRPLPEETLSTLIGGATPTNTQVKEMRTSMETMYQAQATSMTTDQQISNRFMAPVWKAGNHTLGEIYCTTPDSIWKCRQAYNNDVYPDIKPDSSAWYTFNIPLHGTTPETALPFVPPMEAESRYRNGEYMIWTDGKIKHCVRDTAYGPDEDASAWEDYNAYEEASW